MWYRCAMSLTPEVRRKRRALAARLKDPKPKRRGRCLNCFKLYVDESPNQRKKFCSKQCKEEFRSHGSAFGPLKAKLEKLVHQMATKWIEDRLRPIERRLAEMDRIEFEQRKKRFLDGLTLPQLPSQPNP